MLDQLLESELKLKDIVFVSWSACKLQNFSLPLWLKISLKLNQFYNECSLQDLLTILSCTDYAFSQILSVDNTPANSSQIQAVWHQVIENVSFKETKKYQIDDLIQLRRILEQSQINGKLLKQVDDALIADINNNCLTLTKKRLNSYFYFFKHHPNQMTPINENQLKQKINIL